MNKHNSQQRARPQEQEIRQGAKEGRVRKLQDGAGNGGHEGRFRVRDAELVKVMDVGKAEDDGERKMTLPRLEPAMSSSGTAAARKRHSSVMGP